MKKNERVAADPERNLRNESTLLRSNGVLPLENSEIGLITVAKTNL